MSALVALAVAYAEAHPSEVARLLEAAAPEERARLLSALDDDDAARVMAETMPRAVAEAIAYLDAQRAADILSRLEPRSAAALLARVPDRGAALLPLMPDARRSQLQTLTTFGPMRAAGRADPRVVGIPETSSVGDALARLLREPEGVSHYVYVLGERQALTGVANLRELIAAPNDATVASVMVRSPERLLADDTLDRVVAHPAWRRLHALPVVDADGRFLGAITYSAFRAIEAELGHAVAGADSARSAAALAELFGLSTGAVLQWASTAMLQPIDPKKGRS